MLVEFQMKAAAFLAANKAALQAMKLCPPPPIAVGQVQVVIDHFEFGANSLRHNQDANFTIFYDFFGETTGINVHGLQTQLAQEVVVHVTSLNDIMAHPNADPAIVVPVHGTMVFDLDLFAIDQEVYFQARFRQMELGEQPFLPANFDPNNIPSPITIDQILQMVNAQVAMLIPSPAIPIGFMSLLPVKPSASLIVNAGLSVDAQLERISLRMRVGGGSVAPDAPWINFFGGFFDDRLGGNEWSLFLDSAYIAQTMQTAIDRAISDVKPAELQIFVSAAYSNADARARFMVEILGIYDLPDPLGKLEVNPHIPIEISVPSQNTLQMDVGLPDIQELIDSLIPQSLKIFMRLGGPVGALLGALIYSFTSDLKDPDLPPGVVRTSPNNVRFTKSVPLPQIMQGLSPQFTGLLALDDGIALAGPLHAQPFSTAELVVSSRPFRLETPRIDCGGAGGELVALFGQAPTAFDILHAEIFVQSNGTQPVFLCSVTPVNDAMRVFPPSSLRQDSPQTNATVSVHPPVPPPAYYAAPYACDILVKTTAGLRLVRIPPPPMLTQQDIDRMQTALLVELGNCEQLMVPWWRRLRGYQPNWAVDPQRAVDVLHLWQVTVNGLPEGETVTLADASQQTLVSYRGRAGQPAVISALVAPAATSELSILHGAAPNQPVQIAAPGLAEQVVTGTVTATGTVTGNGSGTGTGPTASQGIAVRQQLLLRVGAIALGQPCRAVRAVRIAGRLCVAAVLEDAVAAFDVTNPQAIGRVGHWRMPGVRGAIPWDDGLLLFGDTGLARVDDEGIVRKASAGCEAEGVLDAAASNGLIYAAQSDELGVVSAGLCRLATLPMDDCRSVLRVNGSLIAAGKTGLALIDLSHPRRPTVGTLHTEWPVTRLAHGSGTERDVFVAILEDGSARLLRVVGDGIEEAASFTTSPWFVDAVRLGDVLVRIIDNALEIEQFGASQTI